MLLEWYVEYSKNIIEIDWQSELNWPIYKIGVEK